VVDTLGMMTALRQISLVRQRRRALGTKQCDSGL